MKSPKELCRHHNIYSYDCYDKNFLTAINTYFVQHKVTQKLLLKKNYVKGKKNSLSHELYILCDHDEQHTEENKRS